MAREATARRPVLRYLKRCRKTGNVVTHSKANRDGKQNGSRRRDKITWPRRLGADSDSRRAWKVGLEKARLKLSGRAGARVGTDGRDVHPHLTRRKRTLGPRRRGVVLAQEGRPLVAGRVGHLQSRAHPR